MPALLRECAVLRDLPPDRTLGGDGSAARLGGTAGQWRPLCDAAATVPAGDDAAARAMLEQTLQAFAVSDGDKADGLFTGYYEPQVEGATRRGGRYQAPLLRRPADLVQVDLGNFAPDLKDRSIWGRVSGTRLVRYYDRSQIEDGALASQHLELLYLADPVDAFFLEIQGSGRVRLPDGQVVRVTYDGQNGRPYVPVGRVMVEQGALEHGHVTMQAIRAWLEAHPAEARGMMDANPSFVFFRTLPPMPPDEGPPGALEAALTPGRSLAVDRRFLPLGAPVFVATSDPIDGAPWQHLLLAQDVGGAIKGPARGDIFFGWGAKAEDMAGQMKQSGTEYVLLPRSAPGV
jgi:membrane-bound lytic murein transglycosylase A